MVDTELLYLARDELYTIEKPYKASFDIKENDIIKRTNYVLSTQTVSIRDIHAADKFDLDTNGFCVIKEKTNLNAEDALAAPELVESAYLNELEAILLERFPEYRRLEPFEFVVSEMSQYDHKIHSS
jgi:hypothetical protein